MLSSQLGKRCEAKFLFMHKFAFSFRREYCGAAFMSFAMIDVKNVLHNMQLRLGRAMILFVLNLIILAKMPRQVL